MTRSALLDEPELFSHVLRERADGASLVVWLPLQLADGDRDWVRILTISRDSTPVGTMHVIPAALDTVREQVASGWLSAIFGRWRRRDDDDSLYIPNGSTGTQVAKRRRDAILVVTTDGTEVTVDSLRRHWPIAERCEQLGRNLWLVVGVAPGHQLSCGGGAADATGSANR